MFPFDDVIMFTLKQNMFLISGQQCTWYFQPVFAAKDAWRSETKSVVCTDILFAHG